MAKVQRIARAAHRGDLFAGDPFEQHLARVAATVAGLTTRTATREAAWLYDVRRTGLSTEDLLRRGVAAGTVRVIEALSQRIDESLESYVDRVARDRDAGLVRYAVLADRYDYGMVDWRERHIALAERLGLPGPEPAPVPPHDDMPALLAAYERDPGGHRGALYHAVRSADPDDPALAELVARWLDSADPWEAMMAVRALAARNDPADRPAVLGRLVDDRPGVVVAVIDNLRGDGTAEEIELLHRVVARPDPVWRWARDRAARRLVCIGGPAAQRALDDHPLVPASPPWRHDPDWLRRNGTKVIPTLIDKLADRDWWREAPYALGELRVVEAVGPLCTAAMPEFAAVPRIEALVKIGSTEAVPTLAAFAEHRNADVRVHALIALDRLGDARAVDAALAALDDPHPTARDRAARVLAHRGDERAVVALIRLCDGPLAAEAAAALARIGDPRALPTLWRLFREAPDRRTRHAAGRALARIDGPRGYAWSGDVRVRRAYIWLLGQKPQWTVGRELLTALEDTDAIVRARAIGALARRGDVWAIDHITARLTDPDPRVRAAATAAVVRLRRS